MNQITLNILLSEKEQWVKGFIENNSSVFLNICLVDCRATSKNLGKVNRQLVPPLWLTLPLADIQAITNPRDSHNCKTHLWKPPGPHKYSVLMLGCQVRRLMFLAEGGKEFLSVIWNSLSLRGAKGVRIVFKILKTKLLLTFSIG